MAIAFSPGEKSRYTEYCRKLLYTFKITIQLAAARISAKEVLDTVKKKLYVPCTTIAINKPESKEKP